MTVGVNNNGEYQAFLTYIVVFVANLVYLLPRGALPELVQIYDALLESLFITVMLWVANKGIEWRTKKPKPEAST